MTSFAPLFEDVFVQLREQVSTEGVTALTVLAAEDPAMFIVEVISSAEAGWIDIPEPLVESLKVELFPDWAAPAEALGDRRASTWSAGTEADPVVASQRTVDSIARRVRERRARHHGARIEP